VRVSSARKAFPVVMPLVSNIRLLLLLQHDMEVQELSQILASCRKDLHAARAARSPRPGLDDKIVTAWNGYGISAFARASRTLAAEQPPLGSCFPVDGTCLCVCVSLCVSKNNLVLEQQAT